MFIGTAGWSLPKNFQTEVESRMSHLTQYSKMFNMVEVNSSFYREHLPKTYQRWSDEVSKNFKFSVKISKAFTHEAKLSPKIKDLYLSLENIFYLEEKLGALLIQLPGSLEFNLRVAEKFFTHMRLFYGGPIVLEPRNSQWAGLEAQALMRDLGISKVLADPERCEIPDSSVLSAGGITYFRLHGRPVIYRSSYSTEFLSELNIKMKHHPDPWCVFDNTTFGMATVNALELKSLQIADGDFLHDLRS